MHARTTSYSTVRLSIYTTMHMHMIGWGRLERQIGAGDWGRDWEEGCRGNPNRTPIVSHPESNPQGAPLIHDSVVD